MTEIKKITGEIQIPKELIAETKKEVKSVLDFKKKIEESFQKRTTELSQIILIGAIFLNASDIHIEPEEKLVKLRVRIDGVLQNVLSFDRKIYHSLLSRIKLLAGLKLNVTTRPQDGRFSILVEDTAIEIRASSLPAEFGESIVLRILNPKNLIDIEALGLRKDLLEIFKREIKKLHGMIVVTGPTGSGKTTTLYAILKRLNDPKIKIITIEDPIEYQLEGISQTQVDEKRGYDFANGLRSIMRQDPDVILVGEIRDYETAKIALQAALTGHLVLSTLHTNDAAGTVARLIALGESPTNIAPALNIAIAQRLVRKVCPKCTEYLPPSKEELAEIKRNLKNIPKTIKIPKIDKKLKIAKPKGCKFCNFTGYKGRTAIFECFIVDDEMEEFILKSPSISALRKFAIKKGMVPMRTDGFIKVLNKETTIEEVNRVTAEEE